MQVNELAAQARQGKRPPDVDRAFGDVRTMGETRAKRPDADESPRPAARTPARRPARYGAGF